MNANANSRHDHWQCARHFKRKVSINRPENYTKNRAGAFFCVSSLKGTPVRQREPTQSKNHQAGEQTAGRKRIADECCRLLR
jgi:hypothetical protein